MSTKGSIQNEIVGLLRRVPDTWETFESDQLSETEAEALFLLIGAGMIKRRFELRLRLLNHPLAMETQAIATGEGGLAEALDRLAAGAWHDWRESYEQWKQSETRESIPFVCERIGEDEWRLTKYGVLALDDLSNGRAATVFDFVLKHGRFTNRLPCSGTGELLKFDRVSANAPTSDGVRVQVTNWDECAKALTHLFDRLSQLKAPPVESESLKSGLPDGPGSGAIFNDMIAEYIEKRKQHYDQLMEDAVSKKKGGTERFEAMFGPRAIARHWLTDWIKKLQAEFDDEVQRKQLIDKEENRVAGAIKRQPQYKKRINPPLNGRKPEGWEPPKKNGTSLTSTVADILNRRSSS